MSAAARLALVDRADAALSMVAQCRLLKVARSTLYWRPSPVSADDLDLRRRLDMQYLATPFYGARRMVAVLRRAGLMVNCKHVRRLMRLMGIAAIYQRPNTSKPHPEHQVFPYLLRSLAINRPNQVWCADITYIPMARGFVYLVAIGRGRYLDNIFIERLWRSLKYEEVFIHAYVTVAQARGGIGRWVLFYNDERLHQALGYQTLREIFEAAPACGHVDNASALTTFPQAPQ